MRTFNFSTLKNIAWCFISEQRTKSMHLPTAIGKLKRSRLGVCIEIKQSNFTIALGLSRRKGQRYLSQQVWRKGTFLLIVHRLKFILDWNR